MKTKILGDVHTQEYLTEALNRLHTVIQEDQFLTGKLRQEHSHLLEVIAAELFLDWTPGEPDYTVDIETL